MNPADSLRDLDLERDVCGILADCPLMAVQVHSGWFINELQAATVAYLREHGKRDGLTQYLAEQFGIERGDVYETVMGWRRGGWSFAQVTNLPKYVERLQDLYTRREKLRLATRMAKAAFVGVAVSG